MLHTVAVARIPAQDSRAPMEQDNQHNYPVYPY